MKVKQIKAEEVFDNLKNGETVVCVTFANEKINLQKVVNLKSKSFDDVFDYMDEPDNLFFKAIKEETK